MTEKQFQTRVRLLRKHGNEVFSVTFRKRSTGEIRHMVCRFGVTAGVKGADPDRRVRDARNNLVTVFEMAGDKSGFKCIPVDGILAIDNAPLPKGA